MNRLLAVARAAEIFNSGEFARDLARRVAFPTVARIPLMPPIFGAYLEREIGPALGGLGFSWQIVENRIAPGLPLLIAERIEDPGLPTALFYCHGDVVAGMDARWRDGADALGPRCGRRPLLRARRGGQQGAALDPDRRARRRSRGAAREARLQRQIPGRDRRGNGVPRPWRDLRRRARGAGGGSADRLRRAAAFQRAPDDISGLARRVQFRTQALRARGRASFGQLGRTAGQSCDRDRQRDRLAGGCARADQDRRAEAAADSQFGQGRAGGYRGRRRPRGPHDRHGLGRARPDAGRARLRVEQPGDARFRRGRRRQARQCNSARSAGALPVALRRRVRPTQLPARFARASRPRGLRRASRSARARRP